MSQNKTADFSDIQCPAIREQQSELDEHCTKPAAIQNIQSNVRQRQTDVHESSEHRIWKSLLSYFVTSAPLPKNS